MKIARFPSVVRPLSNTAITIKIFPKNVFKRKCNIRNFGWCQSDCSKRWFPKHVPWTILETPSYFWCPMFSKAGGGWSHVLERNTSLSNYLDWAFNASCPWIGRTCSSRSATIFSLKGQETDLENSEMLIDAFPQVTVNHVFIGST